MNRPTRLLSLSLVAALAACLSPHAAPEHTAAALAEPVAAPPMAADQAQDHRSKDEERFAPRESKPVMSVAKGEAMPLQVATPAPVDALAGATGGRGAQALELGSRPEAAKRIAPSRADKRPLDAPPQKERIAIVEEREDGDAATRDGGEFVSAGINGLTLASEDALSTFAADVDTGSYTIARRYLLAGGLPPQAGVRVEEWVNAFGYSYPDLADEHPFSIHVEGAPLSKTSHVLRIGIQGKRVKKSAREPTHLTFLVDVSGSMRPADRLPLAKQALHMLVAELDARDSISIATYAGNTRLVLPATPVTDAARARITAAIDSLQPGGGTAMGSGMELAYREATKALGHKGSSRVIVLSDGDANIGPSSHEDILESIKGYVSEGVTMSTVGFGTGNLRDHLMEQLADAGNGNYSYVGSLRDAKKIFVENLTGTLQVIAKDTKIQVEMNPALVERYRLIGYENRDVRDQDFRNDKVDAGEIGAGHTVTALYELILKEDTDASSGALATVRVRYKQPRGSTATEVASTVSVDALQDDVRKLSPDGRFAVGVGLAAESFRGSAHMRRLGLSLADAHALMSSALDGPYAEERREIAGLLAPFAGGAGVARR